VPAGAADEVAVSPFAAARGVRTSVPAVGARLLDHPGAALTLVPRRGVSSLRHEFESPLWLLLATTALVLL